MRYIRTSSLVSCCLLSTENTPQFIVSCLRSRERFLPSFFLSISVPFPFCMRSVSVRYPFPFAFPVRFLLIGTVRYKQCFTQLLFEYMFDPCTIQKLSPLPCYRGGWRRNWEWNSSWVFVLIIKIFQNHFMWCVMSHFICYWVCHLGLAILDLSIFSASQRKGWKIDPAKI